MEQPYVYAYPLGAGPSAPPPPGGPPAAVIVDQKYCVPYPVDLAIVWKMTSITDGNIVVKDVNGNLLFKVKEPMLAHDKRILLDPYGIPVLTLKEKLKPKLDVFLAQNTEEKICDFKVKGSWFDRSCVVYAGGESDTIVAHMTKKHTLRSIFTGKDNFLLTVYSNVDFVFIAALVVILDDVNRQDSSSG